MLFAKTNRLSLKIPRFIKTPFVISFLVSSIAVLASLTMYFRIQPMIPLFYTLAEPEQQLVPKEWLFVFPILSTSISFLHLLIASLIKHYEAVLLKLLAWTTVLVQIVLILAMMRILLIIA